MNNKMNNSILITSISASATATGQRTNSTDDLSTLANLTESSLFSTLQSRFHNGQIYTNSGLFLVAVNPWRELSSLYSDDMVEQYRFHTSNNTDGSSGRDPHVYAVCQEAYKGLSTCNNNQTILVTGESGSGKTFNTAKIIHYFASLNRKNSSPDKSNIITLEQQVLRANPILEAFGNAQTAKNNNSSRFGKLIKLHFGSNDNSLLGTSVEYYLLEKSRVVRHAPGEKSFHVFYQLLEGLSKAQKEEFGLLSGVDEYRYLKSTNVNTAIGKSDCGLSDTISAMNIMQIALAEQASIWRLLSAILLLGNLTFVASTRDHNEDGARLSSDSIAVAQKVCTLLGIEYADFQDALLAPQLIAGDQLVTASVSVAKAGSSVDSLAKALYERLFGYIVSKINAALKAQQVVSAPPSSTKSIGVLDIAGFEIFPHNSFEQLCINYTNERLQQFFNHRLFIVEQELYASEGLQWDFVDYARDLQGTIDLIDGHMGVLGLLDEEGVVPGGCDEGFSRKLSHAHSECTSFESVKLDSLAFICRHYAGEVKYDVRGWVDKNRDAKNDCLGIVLASSQTSLIKEMYSDYADTSVKTLAGKSRTAHTTTTIAQKHRKQLSSLLEYTNTTTPHFIRCILPNTQKSPSKVDEELVLSQLRCNGVIEGIRVGRLGYPSKILHEQFYARFRMLHSRTCGLDCDARLLAQEILASLSVPAQEYKIGKSMVFLKYHTMAWLEDKRTAHISHVVSTIQAHIRGATTRRRTATLLSKVRAARVLQRLFRVRLRRQGDKWRALMRVVLPIVRATLKTTTCASSKQAQVYEAEIKDLQCALDEMVQEVIASEEGHRSVLAMIEEEMHTTKAQLAEKTKLNDEQEGIISRLEQMNADAKCQFAKLESLHTQCKLDQSKHEEMVDSLTTQFSNSINTLTTTNTSLSTQVHSLQSQLSTLSTLTAQNTIQTDSIAVLKHELDSCQRLRTTDLQTQQDEMTKLKQAYTTRENHLQNTITQAKRENTLLREATSEILKKATATQKSLELRIEALQDAVYLKNEELRSLHAKRCNVKSQACQTDNREAEVEHAETLAALDNAEVVMQCMRHQEGIHVGRIKVLEEILRGCTGVSVPPPLKEGSDYVVDEDKYHENNRALSYILDCTEEKLRKTEEKLKIAEERFRKTEERFRKTEERFRKTEEQLRRNNNNNNKSK